MFVAIKTFNSLESASPSAAFSSALKGPGITFGPDDDSYRKNRGDFFTKNFQSHCRLLRAVEAE